MKIMVLNAGSSSIKNQLFQMADQGVLAFGSVERIGEPLAVHAHRVRNATARIAHQTVACIQNQGLRYEDRDCT